MKESIKSFFLLIIITVVVGILLLIGLDVFGIITLPEQYSIKKYLKYNTYETVALVSENIISYPKDDYIAENTVTQENNNSQDDTYSNKTGQNTIVEEKTNTTNTQKLPTIVENNNNNNIVTSEGIIYGSNNSYYYNQLNTYGKTIYNEMYKNLDNLKTGTYTINYGSVFNDLLNTQGGETTLTDAFQLAINAILLDHPEIFYLDVTKMYMYTEVSRTILGTTYNVCIGPEEGTHYLQAGFNNKTDVVVAEDKINTIANSITMNLNGSVSSNIKKIHDYLVDNIVYDENDSIQSHTIYGAFINKTAVCDGYTKAYKFLLDYMGIHCVQVCGTAVNSAGVIENHTWNYVFVNNLWYAVDTTWDDPIITGGGYLTDSLRYKNFLCGSDEFFKNHTENGYIVSNGCFSYPILNKNNYQ